MTTESDKMWKGMVMA